MKLKELIKDYKANAGSRDFITIRYKQAEDRAAESLPDSIERALLSKRPDRIADKDREAAALIGEADLLESGIYETEGSDIGGPSYKCRSWYGLIDGDQTMIALGTHPLMRSKPRQTKRRRSIKKKSATKFEL